jgi:two-component system phosphate regulon sensor histidine kinase PhoR
MPFPGVAESVTQLRRAMLAAAVVASAVVVVTSFLLADRISRPLRRLAHQVQQLPSEGGGVVVPTEGYDEVQQLAAAFGSMADELNAKVAGLAEERNKMALVLAHLADGVVITDADGRVSLANPAAVRLLGLPPRQAPVGRPLPDIADDNIGLIWRRCRDSGDEHEIVIERPERGVFLRAVCTPISGARPSGEVLVLQDLSQVRRLETVRRDFISNISHELRTPLASLRALVETLQDGALEDPAAAADFLQRMAVEVDALTQMVQELLELSRIESGQVPIRMVPTDVAAIVREPLQRLLTQAERAGIRLQVDLPAQQLTVLADEERVKQVLTNIVHNAIKFTPAGGRVTVRAARAGGEVVVSVADTGPGIPAKDLPRIFERFYKADRARAGGGTGLGLAIAKHIIQAHGGRIWAESRLRQGSGQKQEEGGSTFYFTLSTAT